MVPWFHLSSYKKAMHSRAPFTTRSSRTMRGPYIGPIKQVFWLPDHPKRRAFPPCMRQWH